MHFRERFLREGSSDDRGDFFVQRGEGPPRFSFRFFVPPAAMTMRSLLAVADNNDGIVMAGTRVLFRTRGR